jgi:DNA-binding NtrC family response regulator
MSYEKRLAGTGFAHPKMRDPYQRGHEPVRLKNTTIMVVDDDPDIRQILEDRLVAKNYRVVTASNGQEALDMVDEEQPALMLLDLHMPVMDGMQVLRKLNGRSGFAVIIITAFGTRDRALEATREGAFDFVTKPFSFEDLDHVINKALRC